MSAITCLNKEKKRYGATHIYNKVLNECGLHFSGSCHQILAFRECLFTGLRRYSYSGSCDSRVAHYSNCSVVGSLIVAFDNLTHIQDFESLKWQHSCSGGHLFMSLQVIFVLQDIISVSAMKAWVHRSSRRIVNAESQNQAPKVGISAY